MERKNSPGAIFIVDVIIQDVTLRTSNLDKATGSLKTVLTITFFLCIYGVSQRYPINEYIQIYILEMSFITFLIAQVKQLQDDIIHWVLFS